MIGDLVAKLIAAGTAPEVAAEVVAEAFAAGVASAPVRVTSADESVTRRREKDRIRQQIRRDNLRTSADLRDNPRMSHDASNSKEESKKEIKEEREAPKRSVRGHRLPEDWRPLPEDRPEALAKLGSSAALEQEILKFHDYWKAQPGQRGLKLDWDATWRNWIRNAKGNTANGQRSFDTPRRSASSDFFAGIASVAADIAGNDPTPRNGGEEIPSGRINIDG